MSKSFLISGAIVGLIGDAALQIYTPVFGSPTMKKALLPYFEAWGEMPALAAAAGLTGGVSYLISLISDRPVDFLGLSVVVDDIYREFYPTIYPTLGPYYNNFSRESTRIYNIITAGLVLGVNKFISM